MASLVWAQARLRGVSSIAHAVLRTRVAASGARSLHTAARVAAPAVAARRIVATPAAYARRVRTPLAIARRHFGSVATPAATSAPAPAVTQQDAVVPAASNAPASSDNANSKDSSVTAIASGGVSNIFGIRGFDWYATAALGLAALIGKEVLLVDEYWVTGGCITCVFWAGWVMAREPLAQYFDDEYQAELARGKEAVSMAIDNIDRQLMLNEFSLSHADELRQLAEQEISVERAAVEYQNLKTKHDARAVVVSRLNALAAIEKEQRGSATAKLASAAAQFAMDKYLEAPANVRAKSVELAIARMATKHDQYATKKRLAADAPVLKALSLGQLIRGPDGKPRTLSSGGRLQPGDPIKALFDEFLARNHSPSALGVEDFVAQFVAKDNVVKSVRGGAPTGPAQH